MLILVGFKNEVELGCDNYQLLFHFQLMYSIMTYWFYRFMEKMEADIFPIDLGHILQQGL